MPRNSWPRNWRAPPPSFVESPVAHFVLTKDLTSERGRSDSEFPEQRTTNEHQSVNGFNATFGCATSDFSEGHVFQETPRTGAVMSVKVGAPKTYVGLLALHNKEMARLESIKHADTVLLRKYLHWFMVQGVQHTEKPKTIAEFIEHDETFREACSLEGFSVSISALNASWALAVSELALTTTTVYTPQSFFGQGGGGGRGGSGRGSRGGRGCASFQGGRGGFQGGGRNKNPPSGNPMGAICRDFERGSCTRFNCKFKH